MKIMEQIVKVAFQRFLEYHNLAGGTLDDGCGNKIKIKKTKDGFYKITTTSENLVVKEEEDGGE
jgi:hypothetical protein